MVEAEDSSSSSDSEMEVADPAERSRKRRAPAPLPVAKRPNLTSIREFFSDLVERRDRYVMYTREAGFRVVLTALSTCSFINAMVITLAEDENSDSATAGTPNRGPDEAERSAIVTTTATETLVGPSEVRGRRASNATEHTAVVGLSPETATDDFRTTIEPTVTVVAMTIREWYSTIVEPARTIGYHVTKSAPEALKKHIEEEGNFTPEYSGIFSKTRHPLPLMTSTMFLVLSFALSYALSCLETHTWMSSTGNRSPRGNRGPIWYTIYTPLAKVSLAQLRSVSTTSAWPSMDITSRGHSVVPARLALFRTTTPI